MATAVALDEPSHMECTVCHEHFTLPRFFPCGHLLCPHCLVTWLISQPEANNLLCRCAIVDPMERKGTSLEDTAYGYSTDLTMAALVEADRLLSKQHVCCVCVNVAAVFTCLTCGDMFCQSCNTLHKKQSVSKHHKVENLTSLTVETKMEKARAVLAELAVTLSAGETELERAIGQLDQHLQDIVKCTSAPRTDPPDFLSIGVVS